MSLEYAERVKSALPASARGYKDKQVQCSLQNAQPQHSLLPGVFTSASHTRLSYLGKAKCLLNINIGFLEAKKKMKPERFRVRGKRR